MARKVGETHSVVYLSASSAEALGVDEGYWVIEDKETEKSTHTNSDGEEYTVRHESNPTPVRRVIPAPDGEGWVYDDEADDAEEGDDED